MPASPSPLSVVAFVILCLVVIAAFLAAVGISAHKANADVFRRVGRAAAFTLLWMALCAVPAWTGWAKAQPMPRVIIFIASVNLVSLLVALSPFGRGLSANVPIGYLVAFQGFRLPLELILHSWALQGVIPETMTWSGSNWDIVGGFSALVLAPVAQRSRAAAWIANLIGIVLLANVMRVAMMSLPLPFAWSVTPALELPFHLPFTWILPVCVGGALFGHVVLTRALLRGFSQQSPER